VHSLFAKLLLSIVAAGVIAAGLLVIRQRQIDTVHEISLIHDRLREREQTLWTFQVQIARRCRPDQVQQAIARLGGSWEPLPNAPGHQPRPSWAEQVAGSSPSADDPAPIPGKLPSELGG
jgi:hypothetical protein